MSTTYKERTSMRIGYQMLRNAQRHLPDEQSGFVELLDAEDRVVAELFNAVQYNRSAFETLLNQLTRDEDRRLLNVEREVLPLA